MLVNGITGNRMFKDVPCGIAFTYKGKIYLKTVRGNESNCVLLTTGHLATVDLDAKVVEKPRAKIFLEGVPVTQRGRKDKVNLG